MSFLSSVTKMKDSRSVSFLATFVIVATFILDWFTPLGYAVWLFYVPAVLLVPLAARRRSPYIVAIICTFLISAGFFLSPPGISVSVSIFNRGLGIGTLWLVAVLLERRNREVRLLSESEDRFRTLITATSSVVYRMNPDWSEMRQLRGQNFVPDTEKPDRNWLMKYIPQDDQSHVMAVIHEAIRTKSIFELEHRVLRVDGSVGWASSRATPFLDKQGEIFEWFGAARDITERKRAEEALQQSDEQYRTLFNMMSEGFCVLEVIFDTDNHAIDCRLDEVNPAFTAHTGWHGAQGKRVRDLAPGIERDSIEIYAKVALTGESAHFENKSKVLNRWFEVSAYRVGESEKPKVAVFFNDITERKRAEELLKQSNEELTERTSELAAKIEQVQIETAERVKAIEALHLQEQMLLQQSRLAAMGEMIGNIAHQWRQPLNVLGLTIQGLRTSYKLGVFTEEFLDESIKSSMALIQHMSKTINDFKNYFTPDKEKVDFNVYETIVSTLALVEGSLKAKSIVVEVKGIGEPTVHGHHNEFIQVLLNIVKNAIDVFSERETPGPKLTISVGSEADRCIVTITDNAGGISEEIIDKIFDPYFTTKGPQQGTGIGLYMSKNIIEKNMGGILTVCNIAEGAQFRIEI